jgi:hypothetical protein
VWKPASRVLAELAEKPSLARSQTETQSAHRAATRAGRLGGDGVGVTSEARRLQALGWGRCRSHSSNATAAGSTSGLPSDLALALEH